MIVTMSLMVSVFGAFSAVNYANNQYWYFSDTADTLEWLANSGVFTETPTPNENDLISEIYSEDDNPIIGVITDAAGSVISQQSIGKWKNQTISPAIIKKILTQTPEKRHCQSYVYSTKTLDNGNRLIVVQDTANRSNKALRVLGAVALSLLGLSALAGVTFFLSRFITEPAKKALAREKQFVSDASHELKTPIGAISINAQALHMEYDNTHVRNILSETERINRLIERLLTLSRLEATPPKAWKNCSLSDIVNEIALTYESVAYENVITYEFDIEDSVEVKGDEDELKQLTAILIDNALKNVTDPGLVSIRLSRQGGDAVLEVKNTGKGIAEKDLPHIFERFYTANGSRNDNSFGLGLPIAKSIVERHKGTITVNSLIDEETEFKVVFSLI